MGGMGRSVGVVLAICLGTACFSKGSAVVDGSVATPADAAVSPDSGAVDAGADSALADAGADGALVDADATPPPVDAGGCVAGSPTCGADGFDILVCRSDGTGFDVVGRCDPDLGDVCAGGACVNACDKAAETRSYEGCDYWAVDLDNAVAPDQGSAAAQQFALEVTTPLSMPAEVTVEVNDAEPGQPLQLRTVAEVQLAGGGDLEIIKLDPREVDGSTDPRLNDGPGTWLSSRAYHIRSTAPIIAYQFNPLDNVGVF